MENRGLRDLAKHMFLFDNSYEHNLDFILVLEMGRNSYLTECPNNFYVGADSFWHWNSSWSKFGNFVVDNIGIGDSFSSIYKNKLNGLWGSSR